MKEQDRVVLNISYKDFTDAINSVLERNFYDDDCWRVVPEILRVLKIKQRREQTAAKRLENLAKARVIRNASKPIVVEHKTWRQRMKLRLA